MFVHRASLICVLLMLLQPRTRCTRTARWLLIAVAPVQAGLPIVYVKFTFGMIIRHVPFPRHHAVGPCGTL